MIKMQMALRYIIAAASQCSYQTNSIEHLARSPTVNHTYFFFFPVSFLPSKSTVVSQWFFHPSLLQDLAHLVHKLLGE